VLVISEDIDPAFAKPPPAAIDILDPDRIVKVLAVI